MAGKSLRCTLSFAHCRKGGPIYDPLRDDPSFQNFLHLVRLAQ
jgi:hypothetical protein